MENITLTLTTTRAMHEAKQLFDLYHNHAERSYEAISQHGDAYVLAIDVKGVTYSVNAFVWYERGCWCAACKSARTKTIYWGYSTTTANDALESLRENICRS